MNIFQKFTLESLKKNKTRTIVTIIGIILSVSMFTAVTEAFASARHFALNYVEKTVGTFLFVSDNQTKEKMNLLEKDKDIEEIAYSEKVGFVDFSSSNKEKPYLYITSISENYPSVVAVNVSEGRLPKNKNEIAISSSAIRDENGAFKIGEEVSFYVGDRYNDDEELLNNFPYSDSQDLKNLKLKNYTVVGLISTPDYIVEPIEAAGYTAYTFDDNQSGVFSVFAKAKSIRNIVNRLNNESWEHDIPTEFNSDYASLHGILDVSLSMLLGGFAAMLLGLIVFGSVALIYNSFSISVSERTKQFGLMKSVGATKKQIRNSVLFEAFVLSVVAVPLGLVIGCLGIALSLEFLGETFSKMFSLDEIAKDIEFSLYIEPIALIAAAVISVLTTLISAYIPARKAVKKSAIEAVRQTDDIKIDQKKVRISPLTYKFFGFSGLIANKNFKRNKKKYKTTVISLFTSVVLFISASSLCSYFKAGIEYQTADYEDFDIVCRTYDSFDKFDFLAAQIRNIKGIDSMSVSKEYDIGWIESSVLDSRSDGYHASVGEYQSVLGEIKFIDDEAFKKLLKENNIKERDFMSPGKYKAVLFDETVVYSNKGNGKSVRYTERNFKDIKAPFSFKTIVGTDLVTSSEYGDSIYFSGETFEENGKLFGKYHVAVDEGEKRPDTVESYKLTTKTLTVGAVIEEKPYFVNNITTLIYPESAEESVAEKMSFIAPNIYIKAKDHVGVTNELNSLISSVGLEEGMIVTNYAQEIETVRGILLIIYVFAYVFIILISLIAAANVFNTISTNIYLRRRELAMLKAVGMTEKDFRKMMCFESLLYGTKSLIFGLPISYLVSLALYFITFESGYEIPYFVPVGSFIIAIFSNFAVVFSSMIYAVKKIRKENTIDALRNENI